VIQSSPVSFIEKSRDMMMSWFCVGYFTHAAMTNDQREVLFQSQKEDKAAELVDYAKTLYDQQDERLKTYLAEAQRLSQTGSWAWNPATGDIRYWSEECFRVLGFDPAGPLPRFEESLQRIHPDDQAESKERFEKAIRDKADFELDHRIVHREKGIRDVHVVGHAVLDGSGNLAEFVGTVIDVTERKRAEEELRQLVDFIPQLIAVLDSNNKVIHANRILREYTGLTLDDLGSSDVIGKVIHPDDVERMRTARDRGLVGSEPFELDVRVLGEDGIFRWFLARYNPLLEGGRVRRWYMSATEIESRKQEEERVRQENLVLREEIDRSSMFEEIVGSSNPMRQLLKKVEKVASSDSTVLILGETGTGKELIARALYRRSKRASRAFVRVNCAAIPQSLIASELFGHEKGAFTGALQRRVGRFEAANGGTLFLDEIGELPMETQIALLRVLQEREFERVGSNHPISVDVRPIAATNRDLPAAVAAGTFRQDLFYRLNVFPITVPPLRERAEDVPLLVEYFVGRFVKEAGKSIRHIARETLEQLKGYDWPGNIRELQNVVERAVILCETDTFVVDESWLKGESPESSPHENRSALADREVEMIEAALAESHGRISGPSGAAAKLGVPRQTLESKIRRLGIDKYGHKRPTTK
jgi:formate hydrogenlyase transcriptional activator